jgi:hypothetical protein
MLHHFGGVDDSGWLLRVEHRLLGRLTQSALLVRLAFRSGEGTQVLVGWVVWARCWVLRERATAFSATVSLPASVGGVVVRLGLTRRRNASGAFGSWWVWSMSVVVGSARSLRTAQWTRASLYL